MFSSRTPLSRRRVFLIAVMTLCFTSASAGTAQAPTDSETVARVRAHMAFLADDLLEGREAGTRGYDIAARYVASQLRVAGFQPAGDKGTYFQQMELRHTRAASGSVTVQSGTAAPVPLTLPADAVVVGDFNRTEVDVSAPAVYVGFGVTAPERKYDDYAKVDARGKIVVMAMGGPSTFPGEVRAYYSDVANKVANAAAHGAVGLWVFMPPSMLKSMPWEAISAALSQGSMTWLTAEGKPANTFPQMQGGVLLSDAGVRKVFGTSEAVTELYADVEKGTPRSHALPITLSVRASSTHRRVQTSNVVARLEGRDRTLAASHVVLTAHLDHTGTRASGSGDRINNGAFDNAAGCAILLEVARMLAQGQRPLRSIVVAFVGAEEQGLVGSDYFAQRPTVPPESIVANVNLDMPVLQWPLKDVVAFGAEHSSLGDLAAGVLKSVGIGLAPDPMPQENIFVRSDQYSFVKQGIPAIYLIPAFTTTGSGDPAAIFGQFLSAHYHQPSDDLSLPIDDSAVAAFTRANYLIASAIANQQQAPAWKPGNFFGEKFKPKR